MYLEEEIVRMMITGLLMAAVLLILVMLHNGMYHMARIYNWNGRKYCYLGHVPIQKENGYLTIRIREKMVDLSYTTNYQIDFGKKFFHRNRYRELLVYADNHMNYLVMDGQVLKTEIPF